MLMKLNLIAHAVLLLIISAGALLAAPPANDNFANRIDLGNALPVSATGSNVEATEQAGEPLPELGLSTVWWRWTAPATGPVEVNTQGSFEAGEPMDTVLAVYSGTAFASLVQIAVNDESAEGLTSLLRFTATAGTTYVIQVLGYEGAEGSLKLNLKTGPPVPANDAFANAITLSSGATAPGTTDGATLQMSEAIPFGIDPPSYSGSSWWAWTAPAAGWVRLAVTGPTYDQIVSVWTGAAVNALTPVISNTGGFSSDLYFQATMGTRYPIAVGNLFNAGGVPVSLTITNASAPPVYNASLTVSAPAVNVTSGTATVNAVFRMVSTQPLTAGSVEIANSLFYFRSVSFSDAQRTSGSSTDGTYTVPIPFARYLQPGTYRISRINTEGAGFFGQAGELSSTPFAEGASRSINVFNSGTVDVTSPTLTNASLTPNPVDVTAGPQAVTVTLQIADNLSGFLSGSLALGKTVNGSVQYLPFTSFGSAQRTAGTAQNGTYVIPLVIPSNALGNYFLRLESVEDASGNYLNAVNSTDPAFPGPFTGTLRVNRTPVHVLNSFTLSPLSVNVTAATVDLTATFSMTSGSGQFSYALLDFNHAVAEGIFGVFIDALDRTAGTATSGSYSVTFRVPRYLTPGNYTATLSVFGTVGESSLYEPDQFPFPAAATTGVVVTNTGAVDSAAPVLTFISATPGSLGAGSATPLTVKVSVTDNLSGVDRVSVYLTASGSFFYVGEAVRISGTARDGIWEMSAPLPSNIPPGVYAMEIDAADALDQTSTLTVGSGNPAQSITVTPATANPFNTFTSNNSLSGNDALASSDTDRDGVDTFGEFGLGMDPRSGPASPAGPAAAGPPAFNLTGSGAARRLTLGFWIPADLMQGNALKLIYTARFTSDGTNWTDVPQTSFAIDAGTSLNSATGLRRFCTVTDPATYSASQPRFGVLRMTLNP